MKPILAYPCPAESTEAWLEFRDSVGRFADSFRQYPGDCEVAIIVCHRPESSLKIPLAEIFELAQRWNGIHYSIHVYAGDGCDIGGAQWLSKQLHPDRLMIMMTTRCYFHKAGWLERYVEAFGKDKDALYSASASWEGGRRHLCTRAYAMRAGLFADYPHPIHSRSDGHRFEIGEQGITDWFYSQRRRCFQVTFDGEQQQPDWRMPSDIYRKGNQSNMLVHDRHTDLYRDADATEKLRLEGLVKNPAL